MEQLYYLNRFEIEHYQYMLTKGYTSHKATVGGQEYIVFPVVDKEYIGIAWPTITGLLDAIPQGSVIFAIYAPLQKQILSQISLPSIKVLLFPRFT